MNQFTLLFHLAAKTDPTFLCGDDTSTLITMEANRLHWTRVPSPCGDKISFATGYVMGREGVGRDPLLPEGENMDYDLGFECGSGVRDGAPCPPWDRVPVPN